MQPKVDPSILNEWHITICRSPWGNGEMRDLVLALEVQTNYIRVAAFNTATRFNDPGGDEAAVKTLLAAFLQYYTAGLNGAPATWTTDDLAVARRFEGVLKSCNLPARLRRMGRSSLVVSDKAAEARRDFGADLARNGPASDTVGSSWRLRVTDLCNH